MGGRGSGDGRERWKGEGMVSERKIWSGRAREGERMRVGEKSREGEKTREGERTREGQKTREGESTREGERTKEGKRTKEGEKTREKEEGFRKCLLSHCYLKGLTLVNDNKLGRSTGGKANRAGSDKKTCDNRDKRD